jgi:hypothetical protein
MNTEPDPSNVTPLLAVMHRKPMMSFGAALSALKQGYKVARAAWKTTRDYLTIEETIEGDHIWQVTPLYKSLWPICQQDVLAQDWVIIEEEYR